jgi:hypothetical protein
VAASLAPTTTRVPRMQLQMLRQSDGQGQRSEGAGAVQRSSEAAAGRRREEGPRAAGVKGSAAGTCSAAGSAAAEHR